MAEEVGAIADDITAAIQLRGLDLTELGITREELETRIRARSESSAAKGIVIEQPVQPQKERQLARQRLDERVKSGAKELLNELSISVTGRELPRRFPQIGATNNLGAAIVLLNMQVQEFLGLGSKERDIATTEELKRAHDSMDTIVDAVAVRFRSK